MGFELPAAIGCQIASPEKLVISILGEGSLQLNIQELQTILQYKLPMKILVFNNAAYGAIVLTQKNFFNADVASFNCFSLGFHRTGHQCDEKHSIHGENRRN